MLSFSHSLKVFSTFFFKIVERPCRRISGEVMTSSKWQNKKKWKINKNIFCQIIICFLIIKYYYFCFYKKEFNLKLKIGRPIYFRIIHLFAGKEFCQSKNKNLCVWFILLKIIILIELSRNLDFYHINRSLA